jgi:hypothetical protein
MTWDELRKSCRVANKERARLETEWTHEHFGNDVLERKCCCCGVSLADVDPYHLIELGSGLVCVECLQKPGV